MTEQQILLSFGGIGIAALGSQWLAWRLRLPAIVFLLLTGIVIGPVTGWFDPDALLGPLLFPFVSLSVAVILFELGDQLEVVGDAGARRHRRPLRGGSWRRLGQLGRLLALRRPGGLGRLRGRSRLFGGRRGLGLASPEQAI